MIWKMLLKIDITNNWRNEQLIDISHTERVLINLLKNWLIDIIFTFQSFLYYKDTERDFKLFKLFILFIAKLYYLLQRLYLYH